jgi:hypothetical protein
MGSSFCGTQTTFLPWLVLAKVGEGVIYLDRRLNTDGWKGSPFSSRTVLWPWLVLTQVGGWSLFTWIVDLTQIGGGGSSLS